MRSVSCSRDATSAIELKSPEMWSMESNPDSNLCNLVARARRMFAAIREEEERDL